MRRCARESSGAFVLLLAGQRYGWRALPKRLPAAALERLLARLERASSAMPAPGPGPAREPVGEAALVRAWYARDENALGGAEYVLRPVSEVEADAAVPKAARSFWGDKSKKLASAQDAIAECLRRAAREAAAAEEEAGEAARTRGRPRFCWKRR